MLDFVGQTHAIKKDTTLKDCYKLCAAFSEAQEPIHIWTASQLHIKYNVPLADLQVTSLAPGTHASTCDILCRD